MKLKKKLKENSFFRISNILIIIIIIILGKIFLKYIFSDMAEQLNIFNKKVSDMESQTKSFNNKLSDIEKQFKSFNNKNNYMDNQFKTINKNYNDIINQFQSINNKFNDINNQFKSINNNYNDIDNQFENINNKYIDIEKEFNFNKNKFNDIENQFRPINQKIIFCEFFVPINIDDFNIFKSFINIGIKKMFNKSIKYFKLLFQFSKNGYDNNIFHEKCDGKNFTVTLIITENNKIFGGFTELAWNKNDAVKFGNKGFVFSINNKEIYYYKKEYYIFGGKWFGPFFGDTFYIDTTLGLDNTNSTDFNSEFESIKENTFLAGEELFSVKDYVVYQIEL